MGPFEVSLVGKFLHATRFRIFFFFAFQVRKSSNKEGIEAAVRYSGFLGSLPVKLCALLVGIGSSQHQLHSFPFRVGSAVPFVPLW